MTITTRPSDPIRIISASSVAEAKASSSAVTSSSDSDKSKNLQEGGLALKKRQVGSTIRYFPNIQTMLLEKLQNAVKEVTNKLVPPSFNVVENDSKKIIFNKLDIKSKAQMMRTDKTQRDLLRPMLKLEKICLEYKEHAAEFTTAEQITKALEDMKKVFAEPNQHAQFISSLISGIFWLLENDIHELKLPNVELHKGCTVLLDAIKLLPVEQRLEPVGNFINRLYQCFPRHFFSEGQHKYLTDISEEIAKVCQDFPEKDFNDIFHKLNQQYYDPRKKVGSILREILEKKGRKQNNK